MRGYVSREAARRDYGVALGEMARSTQDETQRLRGGGARVKLRIGIDVGGTFTDLTGFDEEAGEVVLIRKYHSDPARPGAVMAAITRELEAEFGRDAVTLVLHGSTVALNTLLEEKGVAVGLITTKGFRDVYEIGRQWRGDDVFNIFAPRAQDAADPRPHLRDRRAPRRARRCDRDARRLADVAAAVRALVAQGVEAVAIAFLFAYANPAHEEEAARDRARASRRSSTSRCRAR